MATIHCHVQIEQALDDLGIRQGSTPCSGGVAVGCGCEGANVGDGLGEVFRDKVGDNLNFRTLKAGTNITIATVDDVITIESASGSGNVIGPDPSTLRAIATYANTNGTLLYDNVVRIEDTASGSNYRTIQVYSQEGSPAWRDVIQLRQEEPNGTSGGPMVRVGGIDTMAEVWASEDPFVVTPAGRGKMIHEKITQAWAIEKWGGISIVDEDDTSPFYIQTQGSNGGKVAYYVGDRSPVGIIAAAPGSMYYREDGATSALYQHRGVSYGTVGWVELEIVGGVAASEVSIQAIPAGSLPWDDVQDAINIYGMAGTSDYNAPHITDAGSGNIDIASGYGALRSTDSEEGALFVTGWSAVSGTAIPTDTIRYIGVEYNGGSPQAVVRSSDNWNDNSDFRLGSVVNQGGVLHILNNPQYCTSPGSRIFHRFYETMPLQRADRIGGIVPAGTGVRYLTVSAGELYDGFSEFDISAIDTTGSDTFDAYYRNGSGGWTLVAAQSQWDNANWDDGTGTLNSLGVAKYGIHWLYIEADGALILLYGQGEYNTEIAAELAPAPASVPLRIQSHGRLLGRLIFAQGGTSPESLTNVWDEVFAGSAGGGDVYGPASATDEAIAIFDGSTGKLIQGSPAKVTQPSGNINAIEILQPASPNTWQPVIKIENITPNGMSGGNTTVVGNNTDPLLLRTDSNGLWAHDGTNLGYVLWEKMADAWVLAKQGSITVAVADTTAPFAIGTTGTNGASSKQFVGTRDPNSNVTGSPGDYYNRVNGTSSRLYQHRGTASSNSDWVDVSADADAISIDWEFSSTTTDADPGAGKFRLNNATQSAASQVYINNDNDQSIAFSTLLTKLGSNDVVLIQQKDDTAKFHLYNVTGDAVVASGYHKIPVSSADSGTNIDNTKECRFTFYFSKDTEGGGPYVHGSKTNAQMLAISSPSAGDTVYNTTHDMMFWWTGNTWQCQDTFEAVNNSGTTLYVGDPVVGSSVIANRVSTTSTTSHPNIIGVSIVEVAQGAYCAIAEKGVWDTWLYGVVSIGDTVENLGAGLARSAGGQPNYSAGQFGTAMAARTGSTTSSVLPVKIGFAGQPS